MHATAVLLVEAWPHTASERALRRGDLDANALTRRLLGSSPTPEERRDVRDLLHAKRVAGLYRSASSSRMADDGRALVEFEVPAGASIGSYEVTLHVLTDEGIVSTDRKRIVLQRSGTVTAVADLARESGWLYGLVAVLFALAIGLLAGLMRGLGTRMS